jgi:hypothetical protein
MCTSRQVRRWHLDQSGRLGVEGVPAVSKSLDEDWYLSAVQENDKKKKLSLLSSDRLPCAFWCHLQFWVMWRALHVCGR